MKTANQHTFTTYEASLTLRLNDIIKVTFEMSTGLLSVL